MNETCRIRRSTRILKNFKKKIHVGHTRMQYEGKFDSYRTIDFVRSIKNAGNKSTLQQKG